MNAALQRVLEMVARHANEQVQRKQFRESRSKAIFVRVTDLGLSYHRHPQPAPPPVLPLRLRSGRFNLPASYSSDGRRGARGRAAAAAAAAVAGAARARISPESWSRGAWTSLPRRRGYTRWTSPSRATPTGRGLTSDGEREPSWSTETRPARRTPGRAARRLRRTAKEGMNRSWLVRAAAVPG